MTIPTTSLPAAARVGFCLSLASMLGFFALPLLFQELFLVGERNPDRPDYFEVGQTAPGEFAWRGPYPWVLLVCGLCISLAFFLPRFWHARYLLRMKLPAVDWSVSASPWSYRTAPERKVVLGRAAMDRLSGAYLGYLGLTLLCLWPALVLGCLCAEPIHWFSTVMGAGMVFAGPHEYLPVFVAATFVLVLAAPRSARVLGPLAAGLKSGAVELASHDVRRSSEP